MRKLPYRQEDIDEEIRDLVNALNVGGVPTTGCCSGHNKERGYILLKDQRTLIILPSPSPKESIERELEFEQKIRIPENSKGIDFGNPSEGGEKMKKIGDEYWGEWTFDNHSTSSEEMRIRWRVVGIVKIHQFGNYGPLIVAEKIEGIAPEKRQRQFYSTLPPNTSGGEDEKENNQAIKR